MRTSSPTAPAATTAAPTRDVIAVTAALQQLDTAVAQAEQALAIPVPKKGLFGGNRDARDAAIAQRVKLLEPAATAIRGAAEVLNANGGYRSQPTGSSVFDVLPPGYSVPFKGLGDNAHDMVSIAQQAAANPVSYTWRNDYPWQSQPVTSLADMVGIIRDQAASVTRGEAHISFVKVTQMTAELLYAARATDLALPELQRLDAVIGAVRQLRTSRFADDRLRSELDRLPARVVVDGKLTTDPASLAALEQLHRTTVVDAGAAKAAAGVAAQLERAKQLAEAGDTAGAREIYDALARTS